MRKRIECEKCYRAARRASAAVAATSRRPDWRSNQAFSTISAAFAVVLLVAPTLVVARIAAQLRDLVHRSSGRGVLSVPRPGDRAPVRRQARWPLRSPQYALPGCRQPSHSTESAGLGTGVRLLTARLSAQSQSPALGWHSVTSPSPVPGPSAGTQSQVPGHRPGPSAQSRQSRLRLAQNSPKQPKSISEGVEMRSQTGVKRDFISQHKNIGVRAWFKMHE